jgi:hypothetical protein
MLKKHKNSFLECINKSTLDPAAFRAYERKPGEERSLIARLMLNLTDVLKSPLFTIQVGNSPIKFIVRHSIGHYDLFYYKFTRFRPGFPEQQWSDKPKFIDEVLKEFERWLENVAKEYIEENQLPDLWAQVEFYKSVVANGEVPAANPASFTEGEKESLRRSVQEFRRQVIENFAPTREQEEFIDLQLAYLAKAADRLNTFDWRGLAISTLIGIAINLSVDTERGRLLFRLFQQAFLASQRLLQ